MDVRCERCRAQYVFDDEKVTEAGITIQCSKCGHLFKVKKKALVVTVPVKPEDMGDTVPVSSDEASRSPSAPTSEKAREWRIRQAGGSVFNFKELTTLQKWIVERKVTRDDEISLSGDQWKRLGNIAELAAFFQVVDEAVRGRDTPASMPAPFAPTGYRPQAPTSPPPPPMRQPFSPPVAHAGPANVPPVRSSQAPAPSLAFPLADPPMPPPQTAFSGQPAGAAAWEGQPNQAPSPSAGGVDHDRVTSLRPVPNDDPAWTNGPTPVATAKPHAEPEIGTDVDFDSDDHGDGSKEIDLVTDELRAVGRRRTSSIWVYVLLFLLVALGSAAVIYVVKPELIGLAPAVPTKTNEPLAQGAPAPAPVPVPVLAPTAAVEAPRVQPAPAPAPTAPPLDRAAEIPSPAAPNPAPAPAVQPVPGAVGEAPGSAPPPAPNVDAAVVAPSATQNPPSPTVAPPVEKPAAQPVVDEKLAPAPVENPPVVAPPEPSKKAASKKLAEQAPKGARALLAQARKLRDRGQTERALDLYGQALELEPKSVEALAGRGWCYLDLSQYAPSEESFQRAIEQNPRYPDALMGLAETYRFEGRKSEAVKYYEQYLAAHPGGEDAGAARNALSQLKE